MAMATPYDLRSSEGIAMDVSKKKFATMDEFAAFARDPEVWKKYGCRMSYSADAILLIVKQGGEVLNFPPDVKIDGRIHVAQMLYGLALENGLKARLLEHDPEKQLEIGETKSKWTLTWACPGAKGHKLLEIARHVKLKVDGKEVRFLERHNQRHVPRLLDFLSKCIVWVSRYPVPLKLESLKLTEMMNDTFGFQPGAVIPDIDALVTPMLEDLLYEKGRPVW